MKLALFLITALGVVLGLTACGGAYSDIPPEIRAIGDPSKGEDIFNTGGVSQVPCATCHTLDGTILVGPSLQGIGSRAGATIPGLSAEDYLRQSIISPAAYLVPGYANSMNTSYAQMLSPDDINNVIAYLMLQK